MHLCTKDKIIELIKKKSIFISSSKDIDDLFLDEVRIGIHLRDELFEIDGTVDLSDLAHIPYKKRSIKSKSVLLPGKLYLGISEEEFSIPNNIMGLINTRSKYARVGLEMARSSIFIIPGFGEKHPTPITFEISTVVKIKNLSLQEQYAFLLLFELPDSISTGENHYLSRFPLK